MQDIKKLIAESLNIIRHVSNKEDMKFNIVILRLLFRLNECVLSEYKSIDEFVVAAIPTQFNDIEKYKDTLGEIN